MSHRIVAKFFFVFDRDTVMIVDGIGDRSGLGGGSCPNRRATRLHDAKVFAMQSQEQFIDLGLVDHLVGQRRVHFVISDPAACSTSADQFRQCRMHFFYD